jgi:hypothetical protein
MKARAPLEEQIRDRYARMVSMFPHDPHEVRVRTITRVLSSDGATEDQVRSVLALVTEGGKSA